MKIDEEIAQAEQYLKDLKFKKQSEWRRYPKPDAGGVWILLRSMATRLLCGNSFALIPEEKKDGIQLASFYRRR